MKHSHNSSQNQWGLVLQGGAMRTAYTAGVLLFLSRRGWYPSAVSAVSAGLLNALYYLSGQSWMLEHIWTSCLTEGIIEKRRMRKKYIFNNQRLLDAIIFGASYPLDTEALFSRGIPCVTAAINARTLRGAPLLLEQRHLADIILAAIAHPFAFPAPYQWNGNAWYDGGFFYPTPIDLLPQRAFGGIIIVRTDNPNKKNSLELTPTERAFLSFHPTASPLWKLYRKRYEEEEKEIASIKRTLPVIAITPSQKLPAKLATADLNNIARSISLGMKDAENALTPAPSFLSSNTAMHIKKSD